MREEIGRRSLDIKRTTFNTPLPALSLTNSLTWLTLFHCSPNTSAKKALTRFIFPHTRICLRFAQPAWMKTLEVPYSLKLKTL